MSRARFQSSRRPEKSRRTPTLRRLFVEPLENRHLLAAITGDFAGGTLSFTGVGSANTLEISNAAGGTYTFKTAAADTITITDAGATLTIAGNGTDTVTVTATTQTITGLAIDLGNGSDTVTLHALTGSAAAALTSLAVNDTG